MRPHPPSFNYYHPLPPIQSEPEPMVTDTLSTASSSHRPQAPNRDDVFSPMRSPSPNKKPKEEEDKQGESFSNVKLENLYRMNQSKRNIRKDMLDYISGVMHPEDRDSRPKNVHENEAQRLQV